MNRSKHINFKSFGLGLATGLLFAPRTGGETRAALGSMIRRWASGGVDSQT